MSDTKVKIIYPDGTSIELEGTEEFVEKHWEELKLQLTSTTHAPPKTRSNKPKNTTQTTRTKKKTSINPIPVNLKSDDKKPSLREFYKEKNPKTNQEIIAVFAYYLNKFCNITDMEYGHALSCYIDVGARKPTNFESLYTNVRIRTGYIESGEVAYSAKISISGENFVEQDLPKKDN